MKVRDWIEGIVITSVLTAAILGTIHGANKYFYGEHVKGVCSAKKQIAENKPKHEKVLMLCSNDRSFLDCSEYASKLHPVDAKAFGFYEYELVKVKPEECE